MHLHTIMGPPKLNSSGSQSSGNCASVSCLDMTVDALGKPHLLLPVQACVNMATSLYVEHMSEGAAAASP